MEGNRKETSSKDEQDPLLEEINRLKSQLELLQKNFVGENSKKEDTLSNNNNGKENEKLVKAQEEIAYLRSIIAQSSKSTVTTSNPTWEGELNLNHPGIEAFAKSLHKKYKDFSLPDEFNFIVPFSKGNDLNDAKILWTNLCTIIKVILANNNEDVDNCSDAEFAILGLALNMCVLLAEKRDLAVVRANTDEETVKLFKSMRGSSNFMLGNNKSFMEQAISMREAQVRIGVNVPRQRSWDQQNNNSYHSNNNNGNFRGGNRGRGSRNFSRRGGNSSQEQGGQQFHQQVQQYSGPAPSSGPGKQD